MLRLLLSGATGRMGRKILEAAAMAADLEVTAALSAEIRTDMPPGLRQYTSAADILAAEEEYDILLDFSHPSALPHVLALSKAKPKPLVVATTGFDEEQLAALNALAEQMPLLLDANMSRGIHLLTKLVRETAASLFPQYDMEIIEQHHRYKKDAPSGTALKLARAAEEGAGSELEMVTSRQERHAARKQNEIGISSLRGGSIAGIHEVIFAGDQEILTLKHEAVSPLVFAEGALDACRWLVHAPPGHYSMDDLL